MVELLLSFFASIGFILLIMEICDFFFYRRCNVKSKLTIDLRNSDEQEVIQVLELIAGVQRKQSGKAAIGNIFVILEDNSQKIDFVYHYLKVFNIPASVISEKEW